MSDIEIIGLFHVVLVSYWGIATLLEVLTLRLDFLFVITVFRWIMELLILRV